MATSSRDRISVDLRGLGATLYARAEMLGISTSAFVRSAVVDALVRSDGREGARADDRGEGRQAHKDSVNGRSGSAHRVRLCLRMNAEQAALVTACARRLRLNPGDYVGGLASGVPALARGGGYRDLIAELRASTCELATLGRGIHQLTALLRQGNLQQARPYRDMLDCLSGQVRAHLTLAARALADLRPSGVAAEPVESFASHTR